MSVTENSEPRIRRMQHDDLHAVMQIKQAENWNQTEADWLFLMNSNPDLCLVAICDEQIIGTVTALNYQNKIAWIGMMLVSKSFRGKGISKLLLNTVIEKLKNCISIKLDATPAGVPVYKRLGFVEEFEICRMTTAKLRVQEIEPRGETNVIVSQIKEQDLPSITKMDKTVFAVNRLDLFNFMRRNKNEICLQIGTDTELKGYVFGRNGSRYIQPGPMTANNSPLAKSLLSGVFTKIKEQAVVVDVLSAKTDLIDWLETAGFTHQRSFTRMYLKSNAYAGELENQYLISGPELG